MGDISDRLAPPPISDTPTQVELGHYEYYLYCMVCHGDRGQGLTEEWRNAGDPADANCWQSRCHASNHPPNGFELPRHAPPLIGTYALARFTTIGDLYSYIQASMPWHMPGALEDEQYRQIAVYLADANGVPDLNKDLAWNILLGKAPTMRANPEQAASSVVEPEEQEAYPGWSTPLLMVGGVVVFVVVFVGGAVWAYRHRRRPKQ